MPRNTEDFINGAYKTDDGDSTTYILGTGENALGTQSGAKVRISHPRTAWSDYSDFRGQRIVNDEGTDYVRDEEGNAVRSTWDSENNVKAGETIPMFKAEHQPPVLDFMVATKDVAKTGGMDLAAHAVEETRRRFGERPLASHSTSSHSTPLTNAAIRQGIIRGVEGQNEGELATQSNYMNWGSSAQDMEETRRHSAERINNPSADYDPYSSRYKPPFTPVDPNAMRADKVNIIGEALSRKGINPATYNKQQFQQLSLLDEKGNPLK